MINAEEANKIALLNQEKHEMRKNLDILRKI